MSELFYLIVLPVIIGILLWIIPERIRVFKGLIVFITVSVVFYFSILIFKHKSGEIIYHLNIFPEIRFADQFLSFTFDPLNKTILVFIGFFSALYSIYSIGYLKGDFYIKNFYTNYLFTISASIAVVLTNNLLTLVTMWGIIGFTLYRLIKQVDEKSSSAAKKSFILIGASDSVMIFGIGLIWILSRSLKISEIYIDTNNTLSVIAFISVFIGAITKAGAFPLHTWVSDYTENSPAVSSALLPASFDKLLGIYLLTRITMSLFILNKWLVLTLLIIGGITTITAVMMALIQHNYKKLLGYHAVSQVGYMITGLGLGTAAGIAGGLFHMFNNALYKGGLFLVAGSVEKKTGKSEFTDVGGLSSYMPITFISALIFALSISGVPPFNGFASKWLVYQSIIEFGRGNGPSQAIWPIWLILAIFGSALTLASFIKFISGIFLGKKLDKSGFNEVGFFMWFPQIVISISCLVFGIFATNIVIPHLIKPITGEFSYHGIWQSNFVTTLMIVTIVLGVLFYLAGRMKPKRKVDAFIGGEKLESGINYEVADFYKTVSDLKPLSYMYKKAEDGKFDIYHVSKNIVLKINYLFSYCHSGLLQLYAMWVIIGMIILLLIMLV